MDNKINLVQESMDSELAIGKSKNTGLQQPYCYPNPNFANTFNYNNIYSKPNASNYFQSPYIHPYMPPNHYHLGSLKQQGQNHYKI